jgi:hypothetical protein
MNCPLVHTILLAGRTQRVGMLSAVQLVQSAAFENRTQNKISAKF